jgi:hypothetical protein
MTTTKWRQYKAAIEAVNNAVRHSDRSTWFPKVIERTREAVGAGVGATRVVFEVDGTKATYVRNDGPAIACPEFEEPQANALLHLISNPSRACAVFACPVWIVLRADNKWRSDVCAVDVVVGFGTTGPANVVPMVITPAWDDGRCVYPMIGARAWNMRVPDDAEFIVCACLRSDHRSVVSLHDFCNVDALRDATEGFAPP